MKIRTQLCLAFLLLAVVPLAGIVLYSYGSSLRAVRRAVEEEATSLTLEMEQRVAAIERDLSRRVERVGAMPVWRRLAEADPEEPTQGDATVGMVLSELGDVAPLLRSLEFLPTAPAEAPAAEGEPVTATPGAPPPPPPPTPWLIDVSGAVEYLERETDIELPEGVRAQLVEGLRAGAEAMRKYSVQVAQGWDRKVEELAERAEGVERQAEEMAAEAELRVELEPPQTPLPPAFLRPMTPEERASRRSRAEALRAHLSELRARRSQETVQVEGPTTVEVPSGVDVPIHLEVPVMEEGSVVGSFRAQVSPGEVLHRVLSHTRRDQGEIPFAMDGEGQLITLREDDRDQLEALPVTDITHGEVTPTEVHSNWVVVTRQEPTTGLRFGIARPIRESLEQVRLAAARNFGYGLALIGFALIGILPLSRRMTRGLQAVTEGARQIAHGDLDARVPVRGRNEIGQLAHAFNRMAFELKENQERLVEEERRRRDQEVRQQLLEADNRRKTEELEEARRFQLSLLPRELPEHPSFEVAVSMRTATEVGGDYYDFRAAPGGALVAAVGDATGHGAKAGTMVTVIKSLFSAYPPERELSEFLAEANRAVRKMELGRMAMALCLARLDGRRLSFSSAGMPPALLRRARDGSVEELAAQGMPLGALAGDYDERTVGLDTGDTVLLMSDGLPELPDSNGEPLGYDRVARIVTEAPAETPQDLIDALTRAADEWAGEGPPADDITFVAVRIR